jgi:arginase family enzyme
MSDLQDYLLPLDPFELFGETIFTDGQFGKKINTFETDFPDLQNIDLVIVGIDEMRGKGIEFKPSDAPNQIRKQLYFLHAWHDDVEIADIGNIRMGATINDSYAALQTVLKDLIEMGKKVLILGGSHDVTQAQYQAYKSMNQIVEATCIDASIDLRGDSIIKDENFLLEMLTSEPNFIRHYNHIGFQSYFVHPRLLETLDKLKFDCHRLGAVRSAIEEMEPIIRGSHFISFDISAIKHAAAPANSMSSNGFDGEEACILTQYAGSSTNMSTIGIYGYEPQNDNHDLTAKLIAQMVWYLIDGISKSKHEARLNDTHSFNEYYTLFAEVETLFLQSKRTKRWWMKLPNQEFIPCSYSDYLCAKNNDMPERWLRAQERLD